jgi:hypothetical protein
VAPVRIYIPTNRPPESQFTYNKIPADIRDKYQVTIVVATAAEIVAMGEAGVRCMLSSAPGIGPQRQWILDNTTDTDVLMLDDDLTNWAIRPDLSVGKYIKDDRRAISDAFSMAANDIAPGYAHGSIGHRQFANNKPCLDHDGRMMRALYYDASVLRDHDIRVTLPLMEDFELNLKLLTAGYSSCTYYGVVQDQYRSNAPGGCSSMRTLELQEHCARELQRMFPDFVKLKLVDGWDIGPRWDVSVQWKKAIGAYKC